MAYWQWQENNVQNISYKSDDYICIISTYIHLEMFFVYTIHVDVHLLYENFVLELKKIA